MLEDKLKNNNVSIQERSLNEELSYGHDNQESHEPVAACGEQGLINNDESYDSSNKFWSILNKEFGLKTSNGILKNYAYIDLTDLTDDAKKDISDYNRIFDSTLNYTYRLYSERKVPMSEFMSVIEKYLTEETDLRLLRGENYQYSVLDIVRDLTNYFNVVDG